MEGRQPRSRGYLRINNIGENEVREGEVKDPLLTLLHFGLALSLAMGQVSSTVSQRHQQRAHAVEVHEICDQLIRLRPDDQVLQSARVCVRSK